MAFQITSTDDAQRQLDLLPVYSQRIIEDAMLAKLRDQPAAVSKAIKKLRPNAFAQYQLRVEKFRLLYNVDEEQGLVKLVAVGEKVGNELIVEGEPFHEHEDNPHS